MGNALLFIILFPSFPHCFNFPGFSAQKFNKTPHPPTTPSPSKAKPRPTALPSPSKAPPLPKVFPSLIGDKTRPKTRLNLTSLNHSTSGMKTLPTTLVTGRINASMTAFSSTPMEPMARTSSGPPKATGASLKPSDHGWLRRSITTRRRMLVGPGKCAAIIHRLCGGIRLSYQRKGKVYLLTDNEDVERFIAYISVSQDDVTLYVVEPRSSEVGSVAGTATEEDVVDDNEEEVTTVNEHVEHPFCNSYNPEEEKEEEEIPEEKSPKKMPQEYNWNMPELLQIPEEELVKIAVDCYTKIIRIKKDDCFDTKEDLKIALYTKCVEDGYQLKVNKSSKDRFETRQANKKVLGGFLAELMFLNGRELLRGSPEALFAQLPAYCHNLKLKNPGSVTHIKTDRDGRFELLFIAIGAAIRSFITCMRSVIIVDGAHLKGRNLGVNLLAVAIDANNGILPIAYGEHWNIVLHHGLKKKITKRVVKSTSWRVKPCSNTLFEVLDNNLNGLVDLNAKTCSCMKWQTSGYLCGHVIKVALHLNQDDSIAYAMDCYTTEVYRQTYAEIIYPIPHPFEWDIPDDLQTVFPLAMDRRLPGRPKSHDRIPFKGEEKKRSTCSRCKESGHTRLTCGSPVPSQSSFPLPKYGSSSKSKAHMVSRKRQSKSKSQSQPALPFGTINLGDF
ncbi:hypothetical protein F3Y22_tig00010968pilonHSYRG00196 [Hibiscus syriacus]|uniref:SWIM-type domain-containing protein n=1 Tax=Hibiscus syriacus TaxID=106335 RepID=A0A6A3CAF3_HIBSY|nr:hypothetical protein F3Y22_tig00010968pilonHSYRG00196 [Hibiscus syriacus]